MAAERTGLAAEVPTMEWSIKLDAVPELREAFKDSYASWWHYPVAGPVLEPRTDNPTEFGRHVAAPLVGKMLEWLFSLDPKKVLVRLFGGNEGSIKGHVEITTFPKGVAFRRATFYITDPDELAQACLAAVEGGRNG